MEPSDTNRKNEAASVSPRPPAPARELPGWLRRTVYLLEECFRLPGTRWRFGLEPVVGLVPGLGDVIGLLIGVPALVLAVRRGYRFGVVLLMLVNLLLDAALGSVPLVGDLFDLGWKSHRKNLQLLERPETAGAVARAAGVRLAVLAAAAVALGALLALMLLWLLAHLTPAAGPR